MVNIGSTKAVARVMLEEPRAVKSPQSLTLHRSPNRWQVIYRGCQIIQCFFEYRQSNVLSAPHIMVRLERVFYYRCAGLWQFYCMIALGTLFHSS